MILRYFNNFIKFFIKMDGLTLKHIIERNGRKLADVADALGITPQALNSAFKSNDIKSGTLEKVAQFLGVPICQLYGESCVNNQTNVTGSNTINVGGYDALKKRDEQIDRLLTIIEKMQEK